MRVFLDILLYFVSFGAFFALALVIVLLAGFLQWRALKWLGKLVRAITPD